MAASDLPLVLEAVGLLDQELTRLTRQASVLVGPLSASDRVSTVTNLRKSVERATHAIDAVRERVLDSATELTVERFESAFRARTIVLQVQLQDLKHAESEVVHRLWPAPGRFQSLHDVSTFLLDRIGRVNANWLEAREVVGPGGQCDHRALIGAAADAEIQLLSIGRDVDLISFLAVGASLSSERFRVGCRVIAALLDVALARIAPRSIEATSLARRLAPHSATFVTRFEEDIDD